MITKDVELLLPKALAVIDEALDRKTYGVVRKFVPLFSGGHDSYCACFVASQHHLFDGNVYHFNTGIGSKATRAFIEQVCREEGWKLNVLKSDGSFEDFVRKLGFPGPGFHKWVYLSLKDRCLDQITRVGRKHHRTLLVAGCRSKESARRMSNVEPINFGEVGKDGIRTKKQRLWVNPCYDWSSEDQIDFMNVYGMARNPVKMSLLGMSGECFCGAFARPNELEMIREVCPDVADEIDRLQGIARDCGHPPENCVYGGPRSCGVGVREFQILETGPLCTSCDQKLLQTGLDVINCR